jgi:ligand-binding sensor protein
LEDRRLTEKNNIYIEDVVDVKELQTLQDNWAKATDLAFVTVDCNGTPITKQSNFTPFCKRLRELDAFREKCYYCDACGGRKARRIGKAYVYICHAGLIDFAIPIMIKGQYVGAFLAGQVTSTDFADLKKITTQSEEWKDNQELVELYSQVKEVSVEKIEAVAQIICDSYNYSVEREYANKVNAELREKDYKLKISGTPTSSLRNLSATCSIPAKKPSSRIICGSVPSSKAILTKSETLFPCPLFRESMISSIVAPILPSKNLSECSMIFILYFLHPKSKLLSYILQITFLKYKILLIYSLKL